MDKNFCVIKVAGVQYKVSEGDKILVNKLKGTPQIDVLLSVENNEVKIGEPFLPNVVVKAKILTEQKGKKIDVIKFKAKSRYRRKIGFRPRYTELLIEKISSKK